MIPSTPPYVQAITQPDSEMAQRRAMAKAITLLESTRADHRDQADAMLTALLPATGRAIRLGLSGVPGVGKSTFIEALGLYLICQGHRVAVLWAAHVVHHQSEDYNLSTALRQPVAERLALHALEHQHHGAAGDLLESVDGGDIRVVERRERQRRVTEQRQRVGVGDHARRQYLERDLALEIKLQSAD